MKPNNESAKFQDYPDILSVKDVSQILHIGRVGVYKLLKNDIDCFMVGNTYKVPKENLIKFIERNCKAKGESIE